MDITQLLDLQRKRVETLRANAQKLGQQLQEINQAQTVTRDRLIGLQAALGEAESMLAMLEQKDEQNTGEAS